MWSYLCTTLDNHRLFYCKTVANWKLYAFIIIFFILTIEMKIVRFGLFLSKKHNFLACVICENKAMFYKYTDTCISRSDWSVHGKTRYTNSSKRHILNCGWDEEEIKIKIVIFCSHGQTSHYFSFVIGIHFNLMTYINFVYNSNNNYIVFKRRSHYTYLCVCVYM